MHKLIINQLGPIKWCELECAQFMTFTGFQASGKSTIAKAIYYFRTVKDDIVELAKEIALNAKNEIQENENLKRRLEGRLRDKFLRTFGSSWGMSNDMYIEYHYSQTCYIKISLKDETKYDSPNYIWVDLSPELRTLLTEQNACFQVTPLGVLNEEVQKYTERLCILFQDPYSVVYIPAGRSMITLLSQQLAYIYAMMDDTQKRSLDSCTKDYLERILKLKPEFSEGLTGLAVRSSGKKDVDSRTIKLAMNLIGRILRGAYRYNDGEEQIVLENGKYVKLNFSSSGQQESVWILNLLFYYLLRPEKVLFIIEEPESHLFPDAQKYITEMISLVFHYGHAVVLTTHSPYVLGALNNLLYAESLPRQRWKEANEIIDQSLWIHKDNFMAWFVRDGSVEACMDPEIHLIQNEKIDEISNVINEEFERLLDLQE